MTCGFFDFVESLCSCVWWDVRDSNPRPMDYFTTLAFTNRLYLNVVVWTFSSPAVLTVWVCGVKSLRAFLTTLC